VPSTFTVLNSGDTLGNPAPYAGTGTLRQAIIDANASANSGGPDRIEFNLPAADPGHVYYRDDGIAGHVSRSFVAATSTADDTAIADIDPDWRRSWWSIQPASQLPDVHDPAVIDGYTQPGASVNTLATGDNAVLRIELNGSGGAATDGLWLGHDSTVQGLIINGFFADAGIVISGASRAVVQGNFLGTDASGTVAVGNDTAVVIDDAGSITIGGTTPAARNVISGNTEQGLYIHESTSNSVVGNYIGTNAAGDQAVANVWFGVNISDASLNNVDGNVISGNGDLPVPYDYGPMGITIAGFFSTCQYNTVTNNKIGVGADGTTPIPNFQGLGLGGGAQNNTFDGNVIAHNVWQGVQIGPDFLPRPTPTSDNVFRNNQITDNGGNGVEIFAGNGLTYDWITTQAFTTIPDNGTQRNSILNNNISGNGGIGVIIDGIRGNDNLVYGNTVANNGSYGVQISGGAQGNQIGGTGSGQDNSIHDNGGANVMLRDLGYDLNYEFLPGMEDGEYIANGPTSPTASSIVPVTNNIIIVTSDTSTGFNIDGTGAGGGNTYTIDFGADLAGPVTVNGAAGDNLIANGGTGNNTLYKNHTGPGQGFITWTDGVSALETVSYTGVFDQTLNLNGLGTNSVNDPADHTTINGGPGANIFVITATVGDGVVLNGGSTTNTYQIELGSLAGPVVINNANPAANDSLIVDGAPGDNAIVASGNTVTAGSQVITLNAPLAAATVNGGSGTNQITVADLTVPIQSLTLNGGPGVNTYTLLNVGASIGSLIVQSPPGATNAFDVQGDVPAGDASLMGFVFEDFNDDGQIDFGEPGIAGVSIQLQGTDDLGRTIDLTTVTDNDGRYQFADLRPGSYTVTETQPADYKQGTQSVGTVDGLVTGSIPEIDQFFVDLAMGANAMNYNFGERPADGSSVQHGQTAGIGFWNNKNGQALIKSLNGGSTATQLGTWLADTLPDIFGANAGSNNLAGLTNAQVANAFQRKFVVKGMKLDAQVMATALSVYVTNQTLAGSAATPYGFTVTQDGVGVATFNIGKDGSAVGADNNTIMSILDILLATDRLSKNANGNLYGGDAGARSAANDLYSAINAAGGIS
jgi:parallel beta-helix repeat protein